MIVVTSGETYKDKMDNQIEVTDIAVMPLKNDLTDVLVYYRYHTHDGRKGEDQCVFPEFMKRFENYNRMA